MQSIIYFVFDLTLLYPFLQDWWSFISYHQLLWPWFLSKVKEALSANSCQCQWNQAGACYSLLAGLAGNCSVLHTNDDFVNWHLIRQRLLGPSRWGGETNLEKCQTQSFWHVTLPVVHGKAGWISDFGGVSPGGCCSELIWCLISEINSVSWDLPVGAFAVCLLF